MNAPLRMSPEALRALVEAGMGANVLAALGAPQAVSTGHAELDAALPGGGWPKGALTELIHGRDGIGELSLLAPVLARLSEERGVALIGAPYLPCGPAFAEADIRLSQLLMVQAPDLADRLWAANQSLRSSAFGAVLLWAQGGIPDKELRRLQLAAEETGALAFLFRPLSALRHSSPAALRLRIEARGQLHILKSRGGAPRTIHLRQDSHAVALPVPAAPLARCAG